MSEDDADQRIVKLDQEYNFLVEKFNALISDMKRGYKNCKNQSNNFFTDFDEICRIRPEG